MSGIETLPLQAFASRRKTHAASPSPKGPQPPSCESRRRPRVLLADDHRIVAEGIARLLADAFDVIAIVDDGEPLVEAALRCEVDIIVADVVMQRWSGFRALKEIRARCSKIPFVFLSMHAEAAVVAAAMRAGANGYVLKAKAGRELVVALETVLAGTPYLTPSLAARHLAEPSRAPKLTERQQAILVQIASGLATKQIAHNLGLSTRTVEAHRYTMMQIFDVHSAIDLVRSAAMLGLLVVSDTVLSEP
jgi:DNA-binding NarL/FixJ family response regulator